MVTETREYRTIMYSVVDGNVVVHKFPFDAKNAHSQEKIQKLLERGFTFSDPRVSGNAVPKVIVTQTVDLSKPIPFNQVETPVDEEMPVAMPVAMPVVAVAEKTPEQVLHDKRVANLAKARAAKKAKNG